MLKHEGYKIITIFRVLKQPYVEDFRQYSELWPASINQTLFTHLKNSKYFKYFGDNIISTVKEKTTNAT